MLCSLISLAFLPGSVILHFTVRMPVSQCMISLIMLDHLQVAQIIYIVHSYFNVVSLHYMPLVELFLISVCAQCDPFTF